VQGPKPVAAGAAKIHGEGRRGDPAHLGSHGLDRADKFRNRGLSRRQRDQKRFDLVVIGAAAQKRAEDARGFLGGERRLRQTRKIENLRHRASARKLARSAWPFSEAMLSGWNCTPWTG